MARVFVVGCPRSGTTVLQTLVGAHPRVRAFPESHFFARAAGAARAEGLRHLRLFLDAAGAPWPAGADGMSLVEIFVAALDGAAVAGGADLWSEKTPRHLHHAPAIAEAVPKARFVHVLRRGVDVVASLHRVTREAPERWGGRPRSIGHCVRRWEADVRASLAYLGDPLHHLLRYETLVAQPGDVAAGICGFLGIEHDPAMVATRAEVATDVTLPGETWKDAVAEPLRPPAPAQPLPGVAEAVAATQAVLDEALPVP